MRVRSYSAMLAVSVMALSSVGVSAADEDVTLTLESWRVDDVAVWEDTIIPAFEAANPGIKLEFQPTFTTEYPAALRTRLEGGTAGDLITCRPFDDSVGLYDQGHLLDIADLDGLANFGEAALSAWQTVDGSAQVCMPVAAVGHGFMYNADIFDELGLEAPTTEEEFDAVLQAIADDGNYIPLGIGSASEDGWFTATLLYQNMGPNYWGGEAGRQALISGEARFTDPEHVAAFQKMSELAQYMPPGYEGIGYTDAQNLFALERSAIFPAGSWEINWANNNADFEVGVFPPPPKADAEGCEVNDHADMGIGINPASENVDAARQALDWFAGPEFSQMYTNSLPGFFSLSTHPLTLEDPLSATYASWSEECGTTMRNTYAVLNTGTPSLIEEMWRVFPLMMNGEMTAEELAAELEASLSFHESRQ